MKLRKGVRILLWCVGGLVAALAAVYLLRWPLLGGLIRSKVEAAVADQLKADLDLGDLGGSLLWGIHARNASLRPRPGSPIRSASVARADVAYGFLGSGEPSIRVEGVRVVLAPKEGPAAPVHEVVRDVVSVLRSIRFPGRVDAVGIELMLADGRSIVLERGSLHEGTWTATARTEGLGSIEGTATLRPDGALTFEGKASEGPLKSAKLELGAGTDKPVLKISAEVEGHSVSWIGTASFEKGKLSKVEGELSVKEGRAKTSIDLVTGTVDADLDAVLTIDQEIRADVAVAGALHGPLAGPAEAWTARQIQATTRGATWRGLTIDEAKVFLAAGSMSKIPFKATARVKDDVVAAEGVFGWTGKAEAEATVSVTSVDLAPYLALLKDAPNLKVRDVRASGKLTLRDRAIGYDGTVQAGAGEVPGLAWKNVDFDGAIQEGSFEARRVLITGTAFAQTVTASGKLAGETLSVRFSADEDKGEIGGRYHSASGDFQGRLRLEGRMDWLNHRFGLALPADITPLLVEGKVTREKGDTLVLFEIAGKSDFAMGLQATIRQQDDDWIIAVAPGAVSLPERKIQYEAFTFSITREKASLSNLKLRCSNPEISARLSGSATWDAKQAKIVFRMTETTVAGTPIDMLVARVTVEKPSGDLALDLRWGKDDGDHLHIFGRHGQELDLKIVLVAADLKRPLIRRFLPGVELEGSIAVDAKIRGVLERPEAQGTVRLTNITTAGLPPLTLTLDVKSSGERVTLSSGPERTPYGELTLEGALPLTGDMPLDFRARLLTDDLKPLLDRMTPQARVWIPKGGLEAKVTLQGPLLKAKLGGSLEFSSHRWKPPAPLPEAEDLRVLARLDDDGVVIEMVDGLLGRGPFWASGRFDFLRPGHPLTLWITAWDALAVDDPLARLRVKPDVTLTWDDRSGVRLTGRVEVPLAIYHREFSVSTPGAKSVFRPVSSPRLRLIPGEQGGFLIPGIEGLEGLDLDLTFSTTGEFRIENSVVGLLLHAEGQLTGTAAEPALSGKIRVKEHRGEVKLARGNFLRVESGEVTLPEEVGRTPTVRFQGGVGVGEGAIQVLVEGPLDNPALILRSDPPQPQKDLLAKLAFGLGMGAFTNETAAATLAVYVYAQTQDNWPSADRKESFLDRFRPTVVPGETSQQRRVPWQLPPSGTLRSTSLRTEYVYNSYFSIVAETNREGDVAGDLRLRIRF